MIALSCPGRSLCGGVIRMPSGHLAGLAFCGGIGTSLGVRTGAVVVAGLACSCAAAALVARRGRLALVVAGLLLAGAWLGSVRLDRLDRSDLVAFVGDAGPATAVVTGPARIGEISTSVPVRVTRLWQLDIDEPARLELPVDARPPPQGAVIDTIVGVRAPSPRDEKTGFDEAAYLRRQGVHVVLRADGYRQVGVRGGFPGVIDRLRARVASSIGSGIEGERQAIVAGIVLGQDEGIDRSLRDRFRASGLYHLLAVSGQNVAYVVAAVLLAAWLAGVPRALAQVGAIAAIVGYVAIVGWQPSVVRAGVAGGLASLGWLLGRGQDRWYFAIVGAAVLMAWNPYSLLDPGFELSFAAVAAIFVLVPRAVTLLEGYPLPRAAALVVAVSAACGLVTAPILWIHFGAIPILSVIANALAAPVVAPILGLGLAAFAIEPLLPAAAAGLQWVNGWLAAYLAWCAKAIGGLPFAQVDSAVGAAALAAVVGTGAVLVRASASTRRAIAGVLAAIGVGAALWVAWPGGSQGTLGPPTGLRVSFLDVGQGDAILVEAPGGALLVDQGPPEARVAAMLDEIGVRHLDALVLTHPQRDHVGGAEAVIRELEVDAVLDPALPVENAAHASAIAAARGAEARVVVARAGQEYRLGRLVARVLWPEEPGSPADDPNERAVVLLVSYGAVDVLLTADAESTVTAGLDIPPVEVLKVAHHGSNDPGLPGLLERLTPRVAVISAGRDNDYGHPAPETLATLAAAQGLVAYRTDVDGTVMIESDGERLTVTPRA